MAATYRRVNVKALARYKIILLGEQRHIGVNNLPKVVARQCSGRESNPRSAHRESNALTTAPPSQVLHEILCRLPWRTMHCWLSVDSHHGITMTSSGENQKVTTPTLEQYEYFIPNEKSQRALSSDVQNVTSVVTCIGLSIFHKKNLR